MKLRLVVRPGAELVPALAHHLVDRPRLILASAIRAVALRVRGVSLSEDQAWSLSEIGDLEDALTRLSRRLPVTRTAGPATCDKSLQLYLAVAEVVADWKGIFTGEQRPAFILRLIDQSLAAHKSGVELDAINAQIQELRGRFEAAGRKHREFLRRADRLRSSQLSRLRASILDDDRLKGAEQRLDRVYLEYFQRAAALV